MNEKGSAHIGDVGTSKNVDLANIVNAFKTANTFVGSKGWMAPEMLEFEKSLENSEITVKIDETKLDTFSLGLVCIFLLATEEFKKEHFAKANLNRNEQETQDFLKNIIKPKIPLGFYSILRSMLEFNPRSRYNILELYEDFSRFLGEQVF